MMRCVSTQFRRCFDTQWPRSEYIMSNDYDRAILYENEKAFFNDNESWYASLTQFARTHTVKLSDLYVIDVSKLDAVHTVYICSCEIVDVRASCRDACHTN